MSETISTRVIVRRVLRMAGPVLFVLAGTACFNKLTVSPDMWGSTGPEELAYQIEVFLNRLESNAETDASSYGATAATYDELVALAKTKELAARAKDWGESAQHYRNIHNRLREIRELHASVGRLDRQQIVGFRNFVESELSAVISYESKKPLEKRNEKKK
ncbi:hypothetical protein K8I61_15830 [bacterium]|nr:hypothetical protein [bacterium]